ncbi:hypothetical protein BSKO_03106 [Bryopsis sp. KO-2023]|nr:hypothetical protein BSKO_03106 [Bryopsis sp. KO-2023]
MKGRFSMLLLLAVVMPAAAGTRSSSTHTSNWAVLVCSSRYWFNYRHMANTLSMYRTVKRLGVPDSNIIMMMADEVACNPRNALPGQIFNSAHSKVDLYGSSVEVDYRGYEVTVENFVRVLTGRHDAAVPRSKRMLPDKGSNVLIYLTGHGGNEFLKFQDDEELMAQDVADAVAQMHEKGRYNEILLIVETCQAATMYSRVHSPNVLGMASSKKGESAYSHHNDMELGLSVIDRFTYSTLEFFEKVDIDSTATLGDLMKTFTFDELQSHFMFRKDLYNRNPDDVRVTDFFGNVAVVQQTKQGYPLGENRHKKEESSGVEDPPQEAEIRDATVPSVGPSKSEREQNDLLVLMGLFFLVLGVALSTKL